MILDCFYQHPDKNSMVIFIKRLPDNIFFGFFKKKIEIFQLWIILLLLWLVGNLGRRSIGIANAYLAPVEQSPLKVFKNLRAGSEWPL